MDATIPEILQQGGLVLSYAYIAYSLYKDNKSKDTKIEALNGKVLEAFISQVKAAEGVQKASEQTTGAINNISHVINANTKAIEGLIRLVELKLK